MLTETDLARTSTIDLSERRARLTPREAAENEQLSAELHRRENELRAVRNGWSGLVPDDPDGRGEEGGELFKEAL